MSGTYSNQTEYKSRKSKLFIISVFVMAFVLITSTVLGLRLGMFVANAKVADSSIKISADDNSTKNSNSNTNNDNLYSNYEVNDDNTVWSNYTDIEIFKVSYKNGNNVITVKSDDNENVIAPGTENTYIFNVINTGKTTLEYTVTINSEVLGADDYVIPIEVRIKDHNGNYCVGGYDKWLSVADLKTVAENVTLSANNYEQYSFEWRWQFDNDNDEYDTMLGTLADNDEITQNLKINITAQLETEPNAKGGVPYTGDDSNIVIWITFAALSLVALLLLLVFGNRKEKRDKADNEI